MTPGRFSFYVNRLQVWMGRANFGMILYLFAKESGIPWYLAVGGMFVGASILAWFDSRYIIEAENTEGIMRSPLWMKFLKEWDEFYRRQP